MTNKNSTMDSDTVLFSNGFVKCYSDRLVIHLYYFPFGNKTVQYKQIQSCELLEMRDLAFSKSKLWGMALAPIWWHADFSRYSRRYYILLDVNQWPQIGLTMDDEDIVKVYKILKNKMGMNPLTKDSLPAAVKAS
jgi:hypothetical protein